MPAAILLGASGSVGAAALDQLLRKQTPFSPVITLVRRSQPDRVAQAAAAGVVLHEEIVPEMEAAQLQRATLNALQNLSDAAVAISTLGVGAGTANLSIEEHRRVDVGLNEAFAQGLASSGQVKHLAFMSVVGADPSAAATGNGAPGMPRYSRVKGEAEAAVKKQGLVVSIFRPSMIIGSKHTPWILEKVFPPLSLLGPTRFRAISAKQIATAMISTLQRLPDQSAVYEYAEMVEVAG